MSVNAKRRYAKTAHHGCLSEAIFAKTAQHGCHSEAILAEGSEI